MDQIIVRKATLNDVETLLGFEQGVINTEREFDRTLKAGAIHYYDIEYMITAQDIEIVVAVSDQQIIGSGYARIENSKHYLQHKNHAYLGFMYIDAGFRGQAVNKKIIDALKQWAISRDITEMRLDVYHDNLAAIKAYEKAGFSRHMIEMRMGLNEV